jgi:hypothetical protein
MVASGLLLGAFTLHGYLDPEWQQRQMQAGGAAGPWAARARPSAGSALVQEKPVAPRQSPVMASPKRDAAPPSVTPGTEPAEPQAAAARARRLLAEKRRAEKKKADGAAKAERLKEQQAQQTNLWDWLTSAN